MALTNRMKAQKIGKGQSLNNPRPTYEQSGGRKAIAPTDASGSSARSQEQVQSKCTGRQNPKHALAIRELFWRHLDLPHAAAARGFIAGNKWACEVRKVIGMHLQREVRAKLNDLVLDSENIAFLAAIHSCCFGREMSADHREISTAEYMLRILDRCPTRLGWQEGRSVTSALSSQWRH